MTQEESELSLKDKEVLETSERWRSYVALNSTSAPQLRSRLEESKEKTVPGRAQRDAFILAAYATDLHRTKGTADRDAVLPLYGSFVTGAKSGALVSAFKSRTALDALTVKNAAQERVMENPVAKQPVDKSTALLNTPVDKPVSTGSKPQPVAAPEVKDEEVTPAKANTKEAASKQTVSTKPKASSKADKATYSKKLRVGTRHLANGR